MLGNWKGPQRAVECSPSLSYEWLLQQESKVHLPDARHLVQKNQRPLEQGIDLLVFGTVDSWVAAFEVLRSKLEILFKGLVSLVVTSME